MSGALARSVYRSLRELAMSYFHEYTNRHRKTLRSYSRPVHLRPPDRQNGSNADDCWDVGAALDDVRHYRLIHARPGAPPGAARWDGLRADDMVQYEAPIVDALED
jgi:hypothetical protein